MKTTALIATLAAAGCAVADQDSDDSVIASSLTGDVTLQELSVPGDVKSALNEIFNVGPARRFRISASSTASDDDRFLGALEGLYYGTDIAGNYSIKRFCKKLTPAE